MDVTKISTGINPPYDVNAIVEIPQGGLPVKYEMDKASGALFVDRFLYTPMRYPGNYGFIPHTLSEDGDPCDVLVANTRPILAGAIIVGKTNLDQFATGLNGTRSPYGAPRSVFDADYVSGGSSSGSAVA